MPRKLNILIIGDITVNNFWYPANPKGKRFNWQRFPSHRLSTFTGGVFQLAHFIQAAIKCTQLDCNFYTPISDNADLSTCENFVHTNALLKKSHTDKLGTDHWYVERTLGFRGPVNGHPEFPCIKNAPKQIDIIVINDEGNGFRDNPTAWPGNLNTTSTVPIIIHKMSYPFGQSKLWSHLDNKVNSHRITIIRADDLRAIEGFHLSCALSWERTAKDFMHQIGKHETVSSCSFLIVLFSTDGAILYRNIQNQKPEAQLVFDPLRLEGGFSATIEGTVYGMTTAFTSVLAHHVVQHGLNNLEEGIAEALATARELLSQGYTENNGTLSLPIETALNSATKKHDYRFCTIDTTDTIEFADPNFWRILDQQTQNTRLLVAEEIVHSGKVNGLATVPKGKFGTLETIDRAEIESYGAIRELIAEYINYVNPQRPLCFAVFGPPGSGKSFGVKQVVKSLQSNDIATHTFNISQFDNYGDLVAAFHQIRDISLSGALPFIFFDEFDSPMNSEILGWLKYFLAPMQDGEFKDGEAIHPIGKAIFVFAGGTSTSFAEFSGSNTNSGMIKERETKEPWVTDNAPSHEFKQAKGPDFISRLRGFVNVMGPNRLHKRDDAYILRRAMVLRSNFVRNPETRGLLDVQQRLRIDAGILRAMLHISSYKHGMRSIDALLDMSRISGQVRFNLAALPLKEQLALHVDANEFLWLTQSERYQTLIAPQDWIDTKLHDRRQQEGELLDKIAEQIFLNLTKSKQLEEANVQQPNTWKDLLDEDKQYFLYLAADIPNKLRTVNHGIRKIPDGREANIPDISDNEIMALARAEHHRRCQYLRSNGYVYGEKSNKNGRISSRLVPFEALSDKRMKHYIQGIYAIPVVLKTLGYEIFRMEEYNALTDPVLLDKLARIIHDDYVAGEKLKGETTATNESLVPYDDLPEDKIMTNLDNAASIPKKLRRIGYRMTKLRMGEANSRIKLTNNQIEVLAKMEHSRWVWQTLMQGWVYQKGKKNKKRKTNPCILPWNLLSQETKQYDINTVQLIPELLEKSGYKPVLDIKK